jgi:hypothetical protein
LGKTSVFFQLLDFFIAGFLAGPPTNPATIRNLMKTCPFRQPIPAGRPADSAGRIFPARFQFIKGSTFFDFSQPLNVGKRMFLKNPYISCVIIQPARNAVFD